MARQKLKAFTFDDRVDVISEVRKGLSAIIDRIDRCADQHKVDAAVWLGDKLLALQAKMEAEADKRYAEENPRGEQE